MDRKKRVMIDNFLRGLELALDQIRVQHTLNQVIVSRGACDRFLEQRELLIKFAGSRVEVCKIIERIRTVRSKIDRLLQLWDGLIQLAILFICQSERPARSKIRRIDPVDRFPLLDSFRLMAAEIEQTRKIESRNGIVEVFLYRIFQRRHSLTAIWEALYGPSCGLRLFPALCGRTQIACL